MMHSSLFTSNSKLIAKTLQRLGTVGEAVFVLFLACIGRISQTQGI